jgi:hypothetical protein
VAYTSHGHQVMGSLTHDGVPPKVKCRGPVFCKQCAQEQVDILLAETDEFKQEVLSVVNGAVVPLVWYDEIDGRHEIGSATVLPDGTIEAKIDGPDVARILYGKTKYAFSFTKK